jgi:tRNA threonylcarbamoyladenosine modification (KEOPS) complex  Pcc1 subunit
VKALIIIPLKKNEAKEALNAMKSKPIKGRVKTNFKATRRGLEIAFKASDITSLRAGVNTALKLYGVFEEVKKNVRDA